MSIDARVETVHINEDGSGSLKLVDRNRSSCRGQPCLNFKSAPEEITALNGLEIWGGASSIMLGEIEIAKRVGYTEIHFCGSDTFKQAIARKLG